MKLIDVKVNIRMVERPVLYDDRLINILSYLNDISKQVVNSSDDSISIIFTITEKEEKEVGNEADYDLGDEGLRAKESNS